MFFFLFILPSCQGKKESSVSDGGHTSPKVADAQSMDDYEWILGAWFAAGLDYFEVWEVKDDSTFVGTVYSELGNEDTITEKIEFRSRSGRFDYIPTVLSQNKGRPIHFYSVNAKMDMIQFENMAHDFPNRIVYFQSSEQQVDVRIEGVKDGDVFKSYDIVMSKVEENNGKKGEGI